MLTRRLVSMGKLGLLMIFQKGNNEGKVFSIFEKRKVSAVRRGILMNYLLKNKTMAYLFHTHNINSLKRWQSELMKYYRQFPFFSCNQILIMLDSDPYKNSSRSFSMFARWKDTKSNSLTPSSQSLSQTMWLKTLQLMDEILT